MQLASFGLTNSQTPPFWQYGAWVTHKSEKKTPPVQLFNCSGTMLQDYPRNQTTTELKPPTGTCFVQPKVTQKCVFISESRQLQNLQTTLLGRH